MLRILLAILLIYILYQLFKYANSPMMRKASQPKIRIKKSGKDETTSLIPCGMCQTYLAKKDVVEYKGESFCSEKCRDNYREEGK